MISQIIQLHILSFTFGDDQEDNNNDDNDDDDDDVDNKVYYDKDNGDEVNCAHQENTRLF